MLVSHERLIMVQNPFTSILRGVQEVYGVLWSACRANLKKSKNTTARSSVGCGVGRLGCVVGREWSGSGVG